jgi:hypothetical protein
MDSQPLKKRAGRPPEGLGKKGEPDKIRDYPKILITVRPAMKARLKAIAEHEERPAWKIVDDGINLYFDRMKPKDRRAVESSAKRSVPKA